MKPILLVCTLVFTSFAVHCQSISSRGEFADQSNGLMYGDSDIKTLRYLVDSLNLRFKTCDLKLAYYSLRQARSYYVVFSSKTNDLLEIKKAIDANMSFADVTTKYANFISKFDTTGLVIYYSKSPKGEHKCLAGSPGTGYTEVYNFKLDPHKVKNHWNYEYSKKDKYQEAYTIYSRYFPYELKQQVIPVNYARWIQYVDCMVDTNATVMLAEDWPNRSNAHARKPEVNLGNYINRKMGKSVGKGGQSPQWIEMDQAEFAIKSLKEDPSFILLLNELIEDCIKNNYGNDVLEYLAEECISKEKALLMKRSRLVVGFCSQDRSPRIHARNIALLAAETHSWDIFLRAHLDIMNDRFQRNSDGSYAYTSRKTYLKELEELNLNVVDLMLGLTLRAANVAPNHYYGTVWRTGWALTESKEKERFESMAFDAMKDNELDEFNRGLIFLLYHSYLMRLENDKEIAEKIGFIKSKAHEFPPFIRQHILEIEPPDPRERD